MQARVSGGVWCYLTAAADLAAERVEAAADAEVVECAVGVALHPALAVSSATTTNLVPAVEAGEVRLGAVLGAGAAAGALEHLAVCKWMLVTLAAGVNSNRESMCVLQAAPPSTQTFELELCAASICGHAAFGGSQSTARSKAA